jgi:hypothetical protein
VLVAKPVPVTTGKHHLDPLGERPQRADRDAVTTGMGPEDSVRVVMIAVDQAVDFIMRDPCHGLRCLLSVARLSPLRDGAFTSST